MPVIMIRGTSGSGKTTLVRRVMSAVPGPWTDLAMQIGQKGLKRFGYEAPRVAILGRYDGPVSGGCDGFSWKGAGDWMEERLLELGQDRPVIFEGLLVSAWGEERMRRIAAASPGGMHIVQLATSLQDCLDSVMERRRRKYAAKGEQPPELNPENTTNKYNATIKNTQKMLANREAFPGITPVILDRETALEYVIRLIP